MIELYRRETNGRAGIRWDTSSVVEKVWRDVGGNQEEVMSAEKFGRYKTEVEGRTDRKKGKASAKKQGEIGETLRRCAGGLS